MCAFILYACEMMGVYNSAFPSDGITWDGETEFRNGETAQYSERELGFEPADLGLLPGCACDLRSFTF